MKSKCLIVTSELKSSGPNNVIKSFFSGTDNKNIYLTSLRKKHDIRFIESLNIQKNNILLQRSSLSFLHIFNIIRILKPNVINTHGIRADLYVYLISFILKFTQVCTIHNIPNQDYKMRYGKLVSKLMLMFHTIIFKSKKVKKIAVSNQVKENLINVFDAKNIYTVYNGVNSSDYSPIETNADSKPVIQLNTNKKSIIYCGHLTFLKDPLIVANIAHEFPDFNFIFLGSGILEEELKKIAKKNENIYVMGRVNNVKDYLSLADYFIMPSHTEGMPMALIEALLYNLPIICSDIPIFQEIAELDKFDMTLFKVGDLADLIYAFSTRVKKNTDNNSNNRELSLKYFTSSIMSRKYLEIFNE